MSVTINGTTGIETPAVETADSIQIGNDATSSNNFTIYQPSTPDGTLRIGVGNADSPTEVGRFTSAGIDVTGNIKSDNPFFYAERSGDQTGYNAVSQGDVVVIYNVADDNIGGHYSTSTGKFTAPVDGIYSFMASAYSATHSSLSQSWLVINGSRGVSTDIVHRIGNFGVGTWLVKLSADDTVGYHPYSSTGSSITINTNSSHTYFRGCLLYEI